MNFHVDFSFRRLCLEHSKQQMNSFFKASRRRRARESSETLLEDLDASNVAAEDITADSKRSRRLVDSVAMKALGEY